MRVHSGHATSSPTDLANFLSCRHKTMLDVLAAQKKIARPMWNDPLAVVLRERGQEHERQYIEALRAAGLRIVDLSRPDDAPREADVDAVARTLAAMRAGADVIVQAPLLAGGWFGYADVLRRVEGESAFGGWHYEAHDTKLTRETRGGTILQLCVYTEVLGALQARQPECFHVVTPLACEAYRIEEFAAFYRLIVAEYRAFVQARLADGRDDVVYPEPADHCEVCGWWDRCNARRRADDHLTFVAGLGHIQQDELETRHVSTLAALAAVPLPLPFKPRRGARATYERLREQARVQKAQRDLAKPVYELLPAEAETFGLTLLPQPSPGDLFLDFEGDPFAREGGREYLTGLGRVGADGAFQYQARWALTDEEERAAFEWLIAEVTAAMSRHPDAHIYHYAPYEPAAVRRLMSRYAACEIQVDELLRGGRFVDLFAAVRQSLRAGVESYSIKKMELFYGFVRDVELERAGDQRRVVEVALESGDAATLTSEVRAAVEGYNRDDCRSTLELRRWLETLRHDLVAAGTPVPRPAPPASEASEKVRGRQERIEILRAQLLAMEPAGPIGSAPDAPRLLAFLIDWHVREDKVCWWDYFRLANLPDEELFDEPAAVAGLVFVETVREVLNERTRRPTGSLIQRYRYPPQEMEIRSDTVLKCRGDVLFGTVDAVDRHQSTIDVKRSGKVAGTHPASAFVFDHISIDVQVESLIRFGEHVVTQGLDADGPYGAGIALLRRDPPCIGEHSLVDVARLDEEHESTTHYAVRLATGLTHTVLPVQGPPGAGKTFTGARMICELVRQNWRVGITATGHKVIRGLLDAVAREAASQGLMVRLAHKVGEASGAEGITEFEDNAGACSALHDGSIDVLGGTAWLWARPEFAGAVDVLFVDEAGQMSLANALAVAPSADSLVLLGDPQQLEQPQKGSHPDGVGVSALEHVLGGHPTMPAERGLFLPITWRLAPAICRFTSDVFYEGRLQSRDGLEAQRIAGSARFSGAGLRIVEVAHDGCRNASDEEVEAVAGIVDELLAADVEWFNDQNHGAPMRASDILVVAPYNAHVARLQARLSDRGVAVGTVDKFQGQEAPVVIYSMATSRPEDAPRGLTFLYNLNRLNVATSRARCVCILVASPRLFQPACTTPAQMRLANGLCRYRELATWI